MFEYKICSETINRLDLETMQRFFLRLGSRHIELTTGNWHIGRDASCELRLEDARVSRKHALVIVQPQSVTLRELGSVNGVFINGKRLEGETELHDGDRFLVGPEEFHFVTEESGFESERPVEPTQVMQLPVQKQDSGKALASLSSREREVVRLLAEGHPHRVIAEQLGISARTVETYRHRIREKLGLQSRAELTQFARSAGLLT